MPWQLSFDLEIPLSALMKMRRQQVRSDGLTQKRGSLTEIPGSESQKRLIGYMKGGDRKRNFVARRLFLTFFRRSKVDWPNPLDLLVKWRLGLKARVMSW